MNEREICSECGRWVCGENCHTFDGVILCEDCYQEKTVVCSCCGRRIWLENCEGNESIVLCQRCWDDRYTTCEECGALIPNDEAWYEEGGDYPYCRECYNRKRNRAIKHYGYKPEPIFYGADSDLYMGVELEIDHGGEDTENAAQILAVANEVGDRVYCKHDGSLSEGFEMVSHPMTLAYHKDKMNWPDVFHEALSLNYASHNTGTCGLHIHVNRDAFGGDDDVQESCIGRIVYFVERNWDELVRFSRRKAENLNRWAARYATISPTPKETYKKAKEKYAGRYVAVNLTNYETIEFRMFRGTLRYATFIATLQLVAHICELAYRLNDLEFETMSWSNFVLTIDGAKMPELIEYLKSKQLYVNEPAETVGEEV